MTCTRRASSYAAALCAAVEKVVILWPSQLWRKLAECFYGLLRDSVRQMKLKILQAEYWESWIGVSLVFECRRPGGMRMGRSSLSLIKCHL